jgi:predicted type IV restriction endonuclease
MNHDYDHSKEVFFRLGWLEEDEEKADTYLSDLAEIADRLKGEGAFELDTTAIFVEPLLRGLGWETLDHDQVDRAPGGNYPDFELYGRGKRVAVIEVKSLEAGDRYLRKNAYEQLYGYALERLRRLPKQDWVAMLRDQPIMCGVVTNGRSWQIYDFHGESQDLKCEFDLQRNPDKRMLVASLGRYQLLARLGI